MFDKGIVRKDALLKLIIPQYLANMASKSANYCYLEASHGVGLLLLCEAQLGKPMYRCKHAEPNAAKHCKTSVHIQLTASD